MRNTIQIWKELRDKSGVYFKDDLSCRPVTVDAVGKQPLWVVHFYFSVANELSSEIRKYSFRSNIAVGTQRC